MARKKGREYRSAIWAARSRSRGATSHFFRFTGHLSLLLAFAGCLSLYFIIFPQNMQGGEKACFWGINLSYWGKLEAPENKEGFA